MSRITYVGHATVLVALDGTRLLTDPLLRPRVAHLRRETAIDPEVWHGVDAGLISHAHYDHLDLRSLALLGRSTRIVLPRGVGRLLKKRFDEIVEIGEGETVEVGKVRVQATHAEHHGGRRPWGARGSALGYVISGSRRIFFAGDTELFDGLGDLGDGLDVALVPIWGWGKTLGRGGHLDPEQAAEALTLLRPRIAVPIHWGTYYPLHLRLRGVPDFVRHPAPRFVRAAAERAPEVEVRVLQPGDSLEL